MAASSSTPPPPTDTHRVHLPLIAAAPDLYATTAVWTTSVTIPTHIYQDALDTAYSPQFNMTYKVLNRGRYDEDWIEPRPYLLLVMENAFVRVSLMPQLGGRIYQIVDKQSGKPMLYENPVIKPSPWGPPEMGWWLAAGGIEWCLPVEEHGYEWGEAWQYEIDTFAGGARITLRDSDANDRLRARVTITLLNHESALHIGPTIENPTAAEIDFQFWMNAMLAPGGGNAPSAETRFVISATDVTVHSTGDDRLPGAWQPMPWPVYDGVDWSRLGNWDEWFGFFQRPQAAGGFQAVYDEGRDAGVVRAYSSGEARGAKYFGFGWAHALPPSLYTDGTSAYVEMHGGVTQQFGVTRSLPARQSLTWEEHWYPAVGLGGLTWANTAIALKRETSGGQTRATLVASRVLAEVRVLLVRRNDGAVVGATELVELQPGQIATTNWGDGDAGVAVYEGAVLVAWYP